MLELIGEGRVPEKRLRPGIEKRSAHDIQNYHKVVKPKDLNHKIVDFLFRNFFLKGAICYESDRCFYMRLLLSLDWIVARNINLEEEPSCSFSLHALNLILIVGIAHVFQVFLRELLIAKLSDQLLIFHQLSESPPFAFAGTLHPAIIKQAVLKVVSKILIFRLIFENWKGN